MLKYGNRDFRNLQEQVYANMKNIQDIINGSNIMADLKTANIVGQVAEATDLPDADTYEGNWGDAFLVGDEEDAELYVFTKAYEEENAPQWFNVGTFPEPGPQGEQGIQGTNWYLGTDITHQQGQGTIITSYATSYPNLKVGDLYLIKSTYTSGSVTFTIGDVYEVTGLVSGTAYVVKRLSIEGPQGATGATGPQGPTGATGPQGPAGANGGFWYSGASGITFSGGMYFVYNVGLPDLKVGDLYLVTSTYQSGGITINKGDVFKVNAQSTAISFTCSRLANIQGPQGPAGEVDAQSLTEYLIGDSGINLEYDGEEDKVYASVKYAAPLDLDSDDNLTINLASSLKVDDSDKLAVNPYSIFTPIVFTTLIGMNLNYTSLIHAGNFMSIPIVYQQTVGTTITSVALNPRSFELNVGSATSTIKAEGYDSSNNKYSMSWEFIGSGIYNITVTTP